MTLNEIQAGIVATIKTALTSLKTVEAHGGRFDAAELRRVTAKAPAAFVAMLSTTQVGTSNSHLVTVGVFITTHDKPNQERGQVAAAIVSAMLALIPGQRWGLDDAEQLPQAVTSRNLYGATVDRVGTALWAITWRQQFRLDDEPNLEELKSFITYHGAIDVDPTQDGEPLAADTVTLPQE